MIGSIFKLKLTIMKKTLFISLILLASLQLFSQTKQEKINKFVAIVNSEENTNKSFDNMLQFMKQQSSQDLTQEQQDELYTFMVAEMKIISNKAFTEFYPEVYDKYFSEKDIDEFLKFYQSPSGQKFLKVSPDIQNEFIQNYMSKQVVFLQKKIEQKKKEIIER